MHKHRRFKATNSAHARLRQLQAMFAVFLITLLALPVNAAVVLPDEPLVTGARIPPNVLFVLDNSGSMRDTYMPDDIDDVTVINIKNQTYVRNVIYYNPYKNYQPWVDSTGVEMTGGQSYNAAYSDLARVSPFATGTINLQDAVQTFYVPKDLANPATFTSVNGYYRYQILTSGVVERSEWDGTKAASIVATGYPLSGLAGSGATTTMFAQPTVTVPANAINLVVEATNAANAKLYIRQGAAPTTGTSTANSTGSGAVKTITRTNPAAGDWYIGLAPRVVGGFSGVTLTVTYQLNTDRCTGGGWVNCTAVTPTGRTTTDELRNFATWYSYHRTRFKVAKAGAGRAFAEIGSNYRVGYRNIWNNMAASGSSGGVNWSTHPISRAKPIPVTRNNGLFEDPNGPTGTNNNRTAWYQRLYSEDGSSNTPLRFALWTSGNYFESDHTANGPWGPESGTDQYACRQNFTILTTDGYRNDDSSNNPTYDYTGVGSAVGEQDNVAGPTVNGPSGSTFTYAPVTPYASAYSNTLADIAMRYWKNDLRPDLTNVVATSSSNPAFWQHMATFAISIGAAGTLDPASDLPALTNGSKVWPQPLNLDPTSIDDLWHASVNGRGSFTVATDPDSFTNALKSALADITERTGSASNVAANSTSLDAGTRVFQANYVSGLWTGQLSAFPIVSTVVGGKTVYSLSATPSWQAASGIPSSGRNVVSFDGTNGINFPSGATTAQLTALARSAAHPYPVTGEDNAAYIAGTRSLEQANGGNLRNRPHLLGDIVGSSPAYSSQTDTLYVGANDGMLHAFDAADGSELFAYIPAISNWSNLRDLSDPEYLHKYFVDGPVVVSTHMQTPGENILVGTLGKGGKGLFALDVTVPSSFGPSDVKWERAETLAPAGNMGYIQSRPIIARLNNGVTALIVGNGINSANERAVLLVYNLDTGALIRQIDTGIGTNNGLSAPTGWDGDGNGTVDYIYAGDIRGNVWKFNLSGSSSATWSVANSGSPIFAAQYPVGPTAQPITGGVTVAMHPTTFKPWVFVGTGRFLTAGDLVDTSVQSYYAFVDDGATVTRGDMTEREITLLGTKDGKLVRSFEASAPLPLGSRGWFIDLLTPPSGTAEGERVITDGQVVGDVLVFSSVIPTADACQPDGRGYLNALDAFTGTSTGPSYFDLDGDGVFDDEVLDDGSGNQVPVGSVDLGVGMPTLPGLLRGLAAVSGSGGGTGGVGTRESRNTGRVSWREVIRE